MSELIIHSRITPPKLQANIVRRERLTNLLLSNTNKSLILICAPAGYGKTTVVQELIDYHLNNLSGGIKYSWLQLSGDIKSYFSFINYVIYSIKQTAPDFGENTLQLLESIKERGAKRTSQTPGSRTIKNDIDEVTGTIINELYTGFSHERLLLILDDYNSLDDNNWINPAIDTFIDLLPANITQIIISRTKPGINLTKLYAHRNIFELGSKELTFTYDEIKTLIEDIYNLNYSDEVLKRLASKLEGWITGIHLAVQTYGNEIEKKFPAAGGLPDNIFNFFANEIFEKLDGNTQRFLLETSILEHLDSDICNNLLGITNSKNIINHLLTKNIFIQQVASLYKGIADIISDRKDLAAATFLYQPSFSSFLQNKLYDTYQKHDIQKLYLNIVNYFLKKKDYKSAIHYSTVSEDHKTSITLLKEQFQNLFDEGNYELLWSCINSFDENTVQADAYLLYYKGLLYRYFMSDLDSALKYIEDSITLFEKQKNLTSLINNYVTKAALLIHFGKTQEVIEDLLRLLEVKTTPANRALLLYYLGYAYYINTQYDEAVKYLNESTEICQKYMLSIVLYDIFNVLGNIFLNRGDFIKSTYYFEQNYEKTIKSTLTRGSSDNKLPVNRSNKPKTNGTAGRSGSTGIDKKFLTICNLIDLYAQSGKYEKAKQYLDKGYDIINTFAVPIFELILNISEARLKFEIGDYEETIRISEKLNLLSKKFNRRYHIYLSYRLLAASYLYLNKFDKAAEYLNLASIYINEANKFQTTEFAVAEKKLKFTNLTTDTMPPGRQDDLRYINSNDYLNTLMTASSFFDENNFLYDKVQIYFYLAEYYIKKRNYKTALGFTADLFKISSEKEYVSFLEREFRQSRDVFDFAIQNKLHVDFISRIMQSNLEKINTPWLSDDCKARLSSEISNIYDIELNTFGSVELKVRGKIIPDDKWKRKMRKLILAYIMLNRNKKITKEKIIDIFFQESPAESVDNIFHQSISNIRSAVIPFQNHLSFTAKTGTKKQNKTKKSAGKNDLSAVKSNFGKDSEFINPSFILYEDKILQLNPSYLYYIDTEEFNELYDKINSPSIDTDYRINLSKRLIDIYKGELLPGYYHDWCEDLRNGYLNKFIKTCLQLLSSLKQKKYNEDIILFAERLLKFDKLNDQAYLYLIEAYIILENFSRAADTLRLMKKNFEEEFEGKPPRDVFSKAEKLLFTQTGIRS